MTNDTEEKLPTISDDLVVTKYKMAAEIVNRKFEKSPNEMNSRLPLNTSFRLCLNVFEFWHENKFQCRMPDPMLLMSFVVTTGLEFEVERLKFYDWHVFYNEG